MIIDYVASQRFTFELKYISAVCFLPSSKKSKMKIQRSWNAGTKQNNDNDVTIS